MSAPRKLTLAQVEWARIMRLRGVYIREIALSLGVTFYAAWCIVNGRTYK